MSKVNGKEHVTRLIKPGFLKLLLFRKSVCVCVSGVRYTKFSYHDIGSICITMRYISRYAPVV